MSTSAASPLWQGAMTPVLFAVEGILVATVTLLILRVEVAAEGLRRLALAALGIVLAMNLLEMSSLGYAGQEEAGRTLELLWSGEHAALFWGQVLLGVVAPLVLLGLGRARRFGVQLGAALAWLGVFAGKLTLLVAGQALPFMHQAQGYVPTLVELGGAVGVLGLAGLLFVLGRGIGLKVRA